MEVARRHGGYAGGVADAKPGTVFVRLVVWEIRDGLVECGEDGIGRAAVLEVLPDSDKDILKHACF